MLIFKVQVKTVKSMHKTRINLGNYLIKTFSKVEDVSRRSDTINVHITVFKLLRHLKKYIEVKLKKKHYQNHLNL